MIFGLSQSYFSNNHHFQPTASTSSLLPTSERRAVYHPVILLPDTPPVSPKLGALGFLATSNMSRSIQINTSEMTGSHRHNFSSPTPDAGTSPFTAEPPHLPSLLHEEHDHYDSDAPDSTLTTPPLSPGQALASKLSDHIASLAKTNLSLNESTEDLISMSQGLPGSQHLKVLSSTEMEKMNSPPHTPKGHPLEKKRYIPFMGKVSRPKRIHVLTIRLNLSPSLNPSHPRCRASLGYQDVIDRCFCSASSLSPLDSSSSLDSSTLRRSRYHPLSSDLSPAIIKYR